MPQREQRLVIDMFIGDLSRHGPAIPERYGCCRDGEKAGSVVAGLLSAIASEDRLH